MSAHIKNLDKIILSEAKKLLLEQGPRGITIRVLAPKCGIAQGTIYNYFESREEIVSKVIMSDWAKTAQRAEKGIRKAESGAEGMLVICKSVKSFLGGYQKVFESKKTKQSDREEFCRQLRNGIVDLEEAVFRRFPCALEPVPYAVFAESILQAGTRNSLDDDEFLRVMQRFFNN